MTLFQRPTKFLLFLLTGLLMFGCKKDRKTANPSTQETSLSFTVNDQYNGTLDYKGLNNLPVIKINFTEPVGTASISTGIALTGPGGNEVPYNLQVLNADKSIVITPKNVLSAFTGYILSINNNLKSSTGGRLVNPVNINLTTGLDDTDKFARISDEDLLTLVQKQTFKYFWDFAHPGSGMARERNTSGNTVTTGGTGFGIMALVTAVNRGFITRTEGLNHLQKVVTFLKKADRFHGVYPHWLDGNTAKTVPFSLKDNGGDLVETSFLMAGLLTARQYFDASDVNEASLRTEITKLYNAVEWSWYRKDNSNVLYWHWSPDYNWEMNLPIKGWNESLVTYVLAAASPTFPISKAVYDAGWAQNGAMKNGNTYYGVQLPLGPPNGGPMFFSHYSFLGINPNGLSDAYANYEVQTRAHALINYNYCKANPLNHYGYSENCWGLTASDIPNGYTASSPTNDLGVIAPTAALASMPYTPEASMAALHFFYYKLGNKTWGDYGFYDSFSLKDQWFASSTLAIDQGPIIVMIENYRTKLIWNLFMSAPEVKTGLKNLGFNAANL